MGTSSTKKPVARAHPISAYNYEEHTEKWARFPFSKADAQFKDSWSVDVWGNSMTGANGQMTWRLLTYAKCKPGFSNLHLGDPISFVATPMTDKPIHLTVTLKFEPVPNIRLKLKDLVVEVYSWDKQGNPAPNIAYCWRCRLHAINWGS